MKMKLATIMNSEAMLVYGLSTRVWPRRGHWLTIDHRKFRHFAFYLQT